ncbi:MAG: NAD(P)-dependent oxidoreductase [Mesorhizobium amorphae]|nr:MAG: NAD(P)-dependent oxidoreductase [Mesorhizobium amorphae]
MEIRGTTRSEGKFPLLGAAGIAPLFWNGEADPLIAQAVADATHLVVSAAPGEAGDPALRAFRDAIRQNTGLRWIGYLSTVGVYGDHGGAWIDEETPTAPRSRRSVERVEAEEAWTALGRELGVPTALLRLSGIYGPGRNAFVNLSNNTAKRLVKPGQVFNRIHRDDIAGALRHLLLGQADGAFNVSDDCPAPPQDVVTYAAEVMGAAPPPVMDFATAELSPMQRSFYGENKRVGNAKLRQAGYDFHYPDYRAALDAMWADGSWAGEDADKRSAIRRG